MTQPDARRTRTWMIAGALGLVALGASGFWIMRADRKADSKPAQAEKAVESTPINAETPLPRLASALKDADGLALAVIAKRLADKPDKTVDPIPESESADWQAAIENLRGAFPRFSPYGRGTAVAVVSRIFNRYARDPAPLDCSMGLAPALDMFSAALGDTQPGVRIAALQAVSGLWSWAPGHEMMSIEVENVANWKENLHTLVVRALADPEPKVRAAAVTCLAALPLDDEARPAVAYIHDASPEVRYAVLNGFKMRRLLLDEEQILPLLYDRFEGLDQVAEEILKLRGLTPSQIGLGKMVASPMPRIRASVIDVLDDHPDIDPVVWLMYLSKDSDASVRTKAVQALSKQSAPQAKARLSEMAISDPEAEVRTAAAKVAPPTDVTA
ncbi:MAG TPA: HEAT repeat domain-containing protein, partial [Isosphaeraceae bacterium]|nr:HEAT repeat domain-containing protein [Isosphaeraceae bacterium]